MAQYTFEVTWVCDGGARTRRVAMADAEVMWHQIYQIAKNDRHAGSAIRVVDEDGSIVVFIGAATAIKVCADGLPSARDTKSVPREMTTDHRATDGLPQKPFNQ